MSERLPVVSGPDLVRALGKVGWEPVRQRGSHVRLKHQARTVARSFDTSFDSDASEPCGRIRSRIET